MEFVSLLSAVWQTDRWTGRLTDNGDANVATLLLTVITATCPHSSKETCLIPRPRFLTMTEIVAPAQELLIGGNVHKTTPDRKMFSTFQPVHIL